MNKKIVEIIEYMLHIMNTYYIDSLSIEIYGVQKINIFTSVESRYVFTNGGIWCMRTYTQG